jgi:hypothetical protein
MRRAPLAFGTVAAIALATAYWRAPVAAQTTPAVSAGGAPATRASTAPRTPEGYPDLQGNWSNATVTPLQRPAGQPATLTEEMVAKIEQGVADRITQLAAPSDPNRPAPPQGGAGSTGAAGNVGGYNNFWIDSGRRVIRINGEYRTSLIVDPPDGRVPALTEAGRTRAAERSAAAARFGEFDHPELRPLAERCIASFGSNAGPPMLPNYFYNNNYTIVQTRDHVMIFTEMVHDVRIIPIGRTRPRLPAAVKPWWGDSVGWYEGDTLVIETTNFHPAQLPAVQSPGPIFRGASDQIKVVERISRQDDRTLLYRFTVEDPATYTSAWSGELPFTRLDELIYEYACHEANYALSNILSGERAQEKLRAAKKTPPQQ